MRIRLSIISLLAGVFFGIPAQGQNTVAFVSRAEFVNALNNSAGNPPTAQSSSAFIHDGHLGAYRSPGSQATPVVPASAEGLSLAESSFGQMLAADVPQPNFIESSIRLAQSQLYPAAGQTRAQVEAGSTVFRYKHLMYGPGANGKVSLEFAGIDAWFGAGERQRFESAIQPIRDALKLAPLDRKLHNALLDAYYDRFVPEVQYVKENLAKISQYRLGFLQPGPNEFIIDKEIEIYRALLNQHRDALAVYSTLLTDRMGVDVDGLSVGAAAGTPLGSYLFENEQPARNQMAAQFLDIDGILKTVPTYDPVSGQTQTAVQGRVLFNGYKDYVLLLGLLRDYTSHAAELARALGMRGRRTSQQNDRQEAFDLIAAAQTEVHLSGTLLQGMFSDYEPPPGDASGLKAAIQGLRTGMADLNNVRAFLDGESNLLGFSPDFLVLIQEFPDSTQGNQFDSYDAMIRWIRNTSTSPLNYAETTFDDAAASYNSYRGFADQLFEELDSIEDTHADRYAEITGYDPGDTSANHLIAPLPGSELAAANEAIALADVRVTKMGETSSNIAGSVTIANEALIDANGKANEIESLLNEYIGTTAPAWDDLRWWATASALSQATYDTVADIGGLDGITSLATVGGNAVAIGIMGVINAAAQAKGAFEEKQNEQILENASATYDSEMAKLDAVSATLAAEQELSGLQREQISVSLEVEDALSVQRQEIARRTLLIREIENLQKDMDESSADLHDRYYADPVHFLRSQNNMILAEQAFKVAQRWTFFTLRALEFKWNKDFTISWLGKDWEISSLFKLRNFAELEQLIGAMEEFNRINLIGFNREPFVDMISLKHDLLAPFTGVGADDGRRFDIVAKEMVTATELFRRKLARNRDQNGNIVINLNTFALRKESGFFFLGPRYNNNGSVLSAGKYLDKIEWLKFNVVGTHPPAVRDGNLTYGGTCYLRNRVPPCIDINKPTQISGEYRVFPFLYFYTLDNGVSWQSRKNQEDTIKLVFSQTSGEPDRGVIGSTLENRFLKERSVAATDWVLTIPAAAVNISALDDLEIYVRHLFVSRVTPVCN
ncbi:MAG TPA: hypothetical protein VF773_07840 [Verrucomicrobiae bacterium]